MRNIKLTIEYNGSHFFGWQKQNDFRTVQGELERAFFDLTGENVSIDGSGRTDAGVHARNQVASVKTENPMPVENFVVALNDLLPIDVRIKRAEVVDDDFHARFSSKHKTYQYIVVVGERRSAIECDLVGEYPFQIDEEKVRKILPLFVGKHNFNGFCNADTSVQNFEREIFDFSYQRIQAKYIFEVTGNGFLYNMVRILIGTVLDYARGKLSIDDIKNALNLGERKFAGKTMESNGLYLKEVVYENQ